MKVLVTGAQFHNKGAQSLLFSVMDMLRKKYSDVEVYYMPLDDIREYPANIYKFHIVYGRWDSHMYENSPIKRPYVVAVSMVRSIIRPGSVSLRQVTELHRLLPQMDVILDVSGYQLTSKFSNQANNLMLDYIDEAERYNIPIILMPQSFGPFDYADDAEKMLDRIASTLKKAKIVFAREQEGKNLLEERFGLSNVKLSPDLVLQAKEIDWKNIFYDKPQLDIPQLHTNNNVGIIPNSETLKHGDSKNVLERYSALIKHLVMNGKNVYIFRHSNDLDICKQIYKEFAQEKAVHLIEQDLNCMEYSEFTRQFEFLIASRYHAIVHAYRNYVPCILLGWAIKYQELAENVGQAQYAFDITANDFNVDRVIAAMDNMIERWDEETGAIKTHVDEIQKNNCLEQMAEYLH